MSDDPKPLPCPICSQELVEHIDHCGIAWKHPYKPGVCILLSIVLGDSGDIAEWNHRPAEMKLAQAVAALEAIGQASFTDELNPLLMSVESIARHALKSIRS